MTRRVICRECGVVLPLYLAASIVFASIAAGERADRDIHISHADHTHEEGPYSPSPFEGRFAQASNSGGTAVMFDPPDYSTIREIGPFRAKINWPDDL